MITKVVESILATQPECRDSDRELLINVMQRYGVDLSPRQIVAFRHMPSVESVRRVRQKIQEQGKYLPSERVAKQRRLKGYIMQQNAPKASPERTGQLLEQQPKPIPNPAPTQQAISWLED